MQVVNPRLEKSYPYLLIYLLIIPGVLKCKHFDIICADVVYPPGEELCAIYSFIYLSYHLVLKCKHFDIICADRSLHTWRKGTPHLLIYLLIVPGVLKCKHFDIICADVVYPPGEELSPFTHLFTYRTRSTKM